MAFPPLQFGSDELSREICKDSKYLIFCDSILSTEDRFTHWYQYFNLIVAAVALFIPLVFWGFKSLLRLWRRSSQKKRKKVVVKKKKRPSITEMKMELPGLEPESESGAATPDSKRAKSPASIRSLKTTREVASPPSMIRRMVGRGRSHSNNRNKRFDRLQNQHVRSPLARRASSADGALFPTRIVEESPDTSLSPPPSRGRTLDNSRAPRSRDTSLEGRPLSESRGETFVRRQSQSIQPAHQDQEREFTRRRSQSVQASFNLRNKRLDKFQSSSRGGAPFTFKDVDYERSQSSLSIRGLVDNERDQLSRTDPLMAAVSMRSSMMIEPAPLPSFLRQEVEPSTDTIDLEPETDSELKFNPLQNFDLRIIPLFTAREGSTGSHQFATSNRSASSAKGAARKTVVGYVDLQDIGHEALLDESIPETARELDLLRIEKCCAGLILRVNDSLCPTQLSELLHTLCQQRVGVMVICDPDSEILRSIDFGLLIGGIFENSTICTNGQRRDFFRTIRLREIMGRCADERVERPRFFVGFHDLWHTRPTSAVVRRSYKIAEFYGATLVQGKIDQDEDLQRKLPISMSGFDYLKSNDTVAVGVVRQMKHTYPY
jgi:hypothetical protein